MDTIFCKELFTVKHKPKYSCETAYLFDLPEDTIDDSCTFYYYYNNTYIMPVVLDEGNEINPGTWLNKKSLKQSSNNEIPSTILDYSYIKGCTLKLVWHLSIIFTIGETQLCTQLILI